MLQDTRAWLLAQARAAKPSFASRSPHFNFISVHYFWIIGMSLFASILVYASAGGQLDYIDALFFASGANSQAGLNTVDTNTLNTFQQVCLYVFIMSSNPITIHSSVVLLRLFWFERHFQDLVRQARARRATVTKSRSKSKPTQGADQAERGVAGKNITLMPNSASRITNDGILIVNKQGDEYNGRVSPGSTGTAAPSSGSSENGPDAQGALDAQGQGHAADNHPPQITFANTVTRSDGLGPGVTKLPSAGPLPQHPTIPEGQPLGRDEVLRIPNPRDAERGAKPRRLEEEDAPEADDEGDDHEESRPRTSPATTSRTGPGSVSRPDTHNLPDARQPTIKIAEPQRPSERRANRDSERPKPERAPQSQGNAMDELADQATAAGNVLGSLFQFRRPRIFQRGGQGHDVNGDDASRPGPGPRRRTLDAIRGVLSGNKDDAAPYLSWTPTLGRNSQFLDLTLEQREELGGIEYRALRTLAYVLFFYYWFFFFLSVAFLLPYILSSANAHYGQVVNDAGISRTWWGFFTANSSFFDVGLTLTPDSMMSFSSSQYVLMVSAVFIILGNTGFPIMLRAIIWVMSHVVSKETGLWEELRFLLDHPRRCFTLLFPATATWWLFWILIGLNAVDLILFIILDLDNSALSGMPVHLRVVNGIFQAASTRTAGFTSVNLSLLHPAVQVSYLMMMYISVFPVAISIRRTNVYEEQSLGVYGGDDDDKATANENAGMSYVGAHLRRQLSFDLWYVFLGLFILCITEGGRLESKDFDVFGVLFEIVSAYGTVGMSLGYPGVNASLSSQFSTLGKLVIIAMEIRGRHRGLPYALDRAVLLPSASKSGGESVSGIGIGIGEPSLRQQQSDAGLTRQVTGATATTVPVGLEDSGLRRGRSRDRSIITSFLHPGPPVVRDEAGRTMSRIDRRGSRRASVDVGVGPGVDAYDGDGLRRRHTEPPEPRDEEQGDAAEEGVEGSAGTRARRVFSTPGG